MSTIFETARFSSDSTPGLRVVTCIEQLREWRSEWETLERVAEDCPLCLSYAYCEMAAAIALRGGAHIALASVRVDKALAALWPLAIYRKGLVRVAQELTCGNDEEYGGPLLRSGAYLDPALQAVRQAPADILAIRWVEDGAPLERAIAAAAQPWLLGLLPARIGRLPAYSIRLGAYRSWESFESTRTRKFRSNLRRLTKGLRTEGQVQVGWAATPAETEAAIRWLFANKREWAATRSLRGSFLMRDDVRDFWIGLACERDVAAQPLAATVKVNGVIVAAGVVGVSRRKLEFFFTTYDEAFARHAVGTQLTEFLARWAHARQLELDFRIVYTYSKEAWSDHVSSRKPRFVLLSARGRLMEIPLAMQSIAKPVMWRIGALFRAIDRWRVTPHKGRDH